MNNNDHTSTISTLLESTNTCTQPLHGKTPNTNKVNGINSNEYHLFVNSHRNRVQVQKTSKFQAHFEGCCWVQIHCFPRAQL